jgi:TetR/AcrR family transcriptional repressor of nem operon
MEPVLKDSRTRERLLEVGAQAIAEKSFTACGLTEILKRAGVPKGSFYHYFRSKEDFGVAVIEKEAQEFLEELRPIVGDRRRSPRERLRALFEHASAECAANGPARQCLIPKLALEISQLSEPVQAAIQCAYEQWHAVLAQLVREAQAAGEVGRGRDAGRLANVIVMLWEGATIRMQIDRSMQPLQDFLAFTFETLLVPGD